MIQKNYEMYYRNINMENGYTWNVEEMKFSQTEKLTFKVTLKSNVDIDAGVIFNELYTNKTQNIKYNTYKNSTDKKQLEGTDARENTESTVIKFFKVTI